MPRIEKKFYEGKPLLKAKSKKNPTGLVNEEVLTIQSVEKSTLPQTGETYVVKFKEHVESLALNKTNAKTLVKLFGDETDDWIGKKVKIIIILVNNPSSGAETQGIRIKSLTWVYGDDEDEDIPEKETDERPKEPDEEEELAQKVKDRRRK